MKHVIRHLVVWLILLLAMPLVSFAKNRYQSDLLAQMAESMQMKSVLDTMSNGSYIAQCLYKNHPLTVIVNQGEIEHIGYSIFSEDIRQGMPSPVYNFLERYALQADLPMKHKKTVERQLFEDDVNFTVGSITKLSSIWGMNNVDFSLENIQDKTCRVTWVKDGTAYCSVSFPVNYNLYHGTDIVENQRRLADDLHNVSDAKIRTERKMSKEQLTKLFEPNYFVLKDDSFYVASLNSNNYYIQESNEQYKLLFSDRHPIESFANLLTTNSIDNDIKANIKLVMYDFKSVMINIPLVNFLHYFMMKGCKAYFGMIDKENDVYTAELLMLKREEGYCHSIKLTFSTGNISSRSGVVSGRMNCYIPISKVNFLFEERRK